MNSKEALKELEIATNWSSDEDIPDKVVDWYKNKPHGVCLVDILNKGDFE